LKQWSLWLKLLYRVVARAEIILKTRSLWLKFPKTVNAIAGITPNKCGLYGLNSALTSRRKFSAEFLGLCDCPINRRRIVQQGQQPPQPARLRKKIPTTQILETEQPTMTRTLKLNKHSPLRTRKET
jgi:hypothetical protein